jgi:hypothetical protein
MAKPKQGLNLWINDQKRLFLITARFDVPERDKQGQGWRIEITQVLDISETLRSLLKNRYQEAGSEEIPVPIMKEPESGLRLYTVNDSENFYVAVASDVSEGVKQTGYWRIEPLKLLEIAFEVEEILKSSYRGAEPKYGPENPR